MPAKRGGSSKDGSAFGRGIYFANNLSESLGYAYKSDAAVIRSKLLGSANIADYKELIHGLYDSSIAKKFEKGLNWSKSPDAADYLALRAFSMGVDGWYDKSTGYQVILNHSKIAVSKTTKYHNGAKDSSWGAKWKSLNDYTSGRA